MPLDERQIADIIERVISQRLHDVADSTPYIPMVCDHGEWLPKDNYPIVVPGLIASFFIEEIEAETWATTFDPTPFEAPCEDD
jgi:hypothetical protein